MPNSRPKAPALPSGRPFPPGEGPGSSGWPLALLPIAYFSAAPDGRLLQANAHLAAMLGFASPEELAKACASGIAAVWEDPEDWEALKVLLAARGEVERFPAALRRCDGSRLPCAVAARRADHPGAGGQTLEAVVQCDVERHVAFSALTQVLSLYRDMLDLIPDPVFIHEKGRILVANPAAEAFFRARGRGSLAGRTAADLLHPESLAKVEQRMRDLAQGEPQSEEYRMVLARGEARWVRAFSSPIVHQGRPAVLTLLNDITERRQSEELHRAVVEHAPDAMVIHDDGLILFANPAAAALFHAKSPAAMTGWTLFDLFHPDSRPVLHERRRMVHSSQGPCAGEYAFRLLDGEPRHVFARTVRVTYQGRQVLLSVFHDLTGRRLAEAALEETGLLYRTILDLSSSPILVHDRGAVLFANRAAEAFFKRPLESLAPADYLAPESAALIERRIEAILAGENLSGEYLVVLPDGERRWVQDNSVAIPYRGREAILTLLRDLTERRQAEQDLAEAEQLYRVIVEASPDPHIIHDDGRILFANPAAGAFFGVEDLERMAGMDFGELFHPESRHIYHARRAAVRAGQTIPAEYAFRTIGGEQRHIHGRTQPIRFRGRQAMLSTIHDLTELDLARSRLRDLFESAPLGIGMSTPEGRYSQVNRRMAEIFGYPSAGDMVREVTDIGQQLYADSADSTRLRRLADHQGVVQDFECLSRRRDGSLFWAARSVRAVRDAEGRLLGYESFVRDISLRRRAEAALEESRQRLADILGHAPVGFAVTTPQGGLLQANRRYAEMHGYATAEEMMAEVRDVGRQVFARPEDYMELRRLLVAAAVVRDFERQCRRRDGSLFWTSRHARAVCDPAGRFLGYESFVLDIDARRKAEESYQDILRLAPVGFERSTPDGRYLEVNPRLAEMHGYATAEDMLAEVRDPGAQVFARPEDCQELRRRLERADVVRDFECLGRRWDGSLFWTSRHARAAYDPDGGFLGYESFVLDIDARRKAEEDLRVKEQAIASSLTGVVLTSLEGRLFYVNQATLDMWGYRDEAEVLGRCSEEFWADPREFAAAFAALKAAGSWRGELLARRRDGSAFPALVSGSRVHDEKGVPVAITASLVDITDLKQAEAMAHERGRRVRALAAELAMASERERRKMAQDLHDGPVQHLALVAMVIRSLFRHVPDPKLLDTPLTLLAEAEGMLRSTIADLSPPALFHEDLAGALDRLAREFQERHFLEVDTSCPDLPGLPVEARAFLFRAARELLVNALKHGHARRAAVRVEARGHTLALLVEDDGQGFDPGLLDAPDLASQGLPGLRSRARDLGGELRVDSAPGAGARLRLVLPRDALGLAAEPSDGGEG